MWKEDLKIFENSPCGIRDYFEYLQRNFKNSLILFSKESILNDINKFNDDLFYQRKNIDKYFSEGNFSEIFSIFYHYFEIDWDFLSFQALKQKNNLNLSYEQEFSSIQTSTFAKHILFDTEMLLAKTGSNHLVFMFLFFMPGVNKKELLFHLKKNRQLMSCNAVTLEYFYMLEELTKKYNEKSYNLSLKDYNFNHQLIEDYIESSINLNGYSSNFCWKKELPLEKMKFLLNIGCNFNDFEIFISKKNKIMYPNLYSDLMKFQYSIIYEKLDSGLSVKSVQEQKLIKL